MSSPPNVFPELEEQPMKIIIMSDRVPVQIDEIEWTEVAQVSDVTDPLLFNHRSKGFIRVLERHSDQPSHESDCLVYSVVTSRAEYLNLCENSVNEAGYLIDSGDSEMLADAINNVCSDLGWPFPIAHACLSRMPPEIL